MTDLGQREIDGEIAGALSAVRERIAGACRIAGRDPDSVTCVGVSKYQPVALIRAAVRCGQLDFGENYAQELRDKAAESAELTEVRWHAIGPLQRNKVSYVARHAAAFHALDRLDIAQALGRRRVGDPLRCYVQVNVGGEATKSGVAPEEVAGFLDNLAGVAGIRVVGLMTLPPAADDAELTRPYFRRLRELAARHGLTELSMGTTYDYEVAIQEGATAVRVGRAIFGVRHAKLAGTPYANLDADALMRYRP